MDELADVFFGFFLIVAYISAIIYVCINQSDTVIDNLIVCSSDNIQSCKSYKNVEILDSTDNHIVIKIDENIFTLTGKIFNCD